jgi:hypothetical protein
LELNSDILLYSCCGFVFEKYCIFLKADESLTPDVPTSENFMKFKILALSEGDSTKCAGVEVVLLLLRF